MLQQQRRGGKRTFEDSRSCFANTRYSVTLFVHSTPVSALAFRVASRVRYQNWRAFSMQRITISLRCLA